MVVADDEPPAEATPGRTAYEFWATRAGDASGSDAAFGTTIRVVEMPAGAVREMHRTDTIDYGVLLAGELYLVLEKGETVLRAGDVVVQRGTNHGWQNRSTTVARIAFINMTGQCDADAGNQAVAGLRPVND